MTDFGKTIRLQRRLKSLTLKDLSVKTGLSISFLSEVERGISQPSIASLRKIAQTLGISLLGLSDGDDRREADNPADGIPQRPLPSPGPYVTDVRGARAGRRKRISFPGMKGYFELLTPDLNRLIEALNFKLEPGFTSGQEQFSDLPGEKFMLILEGNLEFHVAEQVYVLNEMDSLYYPADAPIFYKVLGEKTVKGVLVITPPGF
jgi:transcriptional regulator with XRE-family HTH domain